MIQVHTNRSDVAYRQGQAPGELALNIEIPLALIAVRRIEFNKRGLERIESDERDDVIRKCTRRNRGQSGRQIERRSARHPQDELIRESDDIEHRDSASDRRLAVLERVPSEAETGRKVLFPRVVEVRITGNRRGVSDVTQICKFSIYFRRNRTDFIAHTQIDREVGTDAEVVLDIRAE